MTHFTTSLLNQDLDGQKIHKQQKEIKKDTIEAYQKVEASEAMVEHLRKVLAKSESNLAMLRSNLAETKANMVVARDDLELKR